MDKENGDRTKSKPSDANPLLDPLNVFAGHSIFGGGGLGAGYGHPLTNAYSAMMGGGGRSGQFPPAPHPPTTNAYGSLGTLSVAASQAASLGINSASAAWWTMASHLAAQDYLARLQAAGMPFPSMSPDMLQGFPLMSPQHTQGASKQTQSSHGKSSASHGHMGMSSHHHRDSNPLHHKDHQGSYRAKLSPGSQGHSQNKAVQSRGSMSSSTQSTHQSIPSIGNSRDPGSVLGGVRLPPDTEIIKYTSSIVGPKVPGTTNRGRKKTISLDPPSVSVTPTIASSAVNMDRLRKNKHLEEPTLMQHSPHLVAPRDTPSELSELLSLQSGVSNGQVTPLASPVPPVDNDAPLNLSLKPAPSTNQTINNALQSLSSLSQSLGNMPERISRRKPGPKPRRVTPSPLPPPGPSPSASLVQLFAAAADVPRPSSVDDTDLSTHHKDGRPRNLGRGVSKPKKNTVASLLAQSRALGLKPGLDFHSSFGSQIGSLQAEHDAETETDKCKPSSPETVADQIDKDKKYLDEMRMKSDNEIMSAGKINYSEIISRALSPGNTSETDYESDDSASNHKQDDYISQGTMTLSQDTKVTSKKYDDDYYYIYKGFKTNVSVSEEDSDLNLSDNDYMKKLAERILGSNSEHSFGETGEANNRKRKLNLLDDDLRFPLERGWKRETVVKGFDQEAVIQGDVTYIAPCGKVLKHMGEVMQYLVQNNIEELSKFNFWFSSEATVGEFILSVDGHNPRKMSEAEMHIFRSELKKGLIALESLSMEAESSKVSEKDKESFASNEDKKVLKEEANRNKELTRFIKEQEKCEKQEAMKKEREQRNIQMLEARRKRQEEAGKIRQEEQLRKQQVTYPVDERELKRQHAALVKEQIYMQELSKQREVLYTVELERERRRQHMALVKSLEARKKHEEREKRRLEVKAEKMASREKRIEQRRIEMDLLSEIRKPVEDMELPDLKPLPELNRITGLKLSGQAFSDAIMVFEFLHNYGETLGFDMGSLPTLNSLQNALLGDEEAEEELLSVMTHLIICAIEDPGIPNPARHTTLLGQSLKQADISHANISEILRIYLYANATGEVKALTGVQFEREREKRLSDHHNNMTESNCEESETGKNAAFFVALRENSTWQMSEILKHKPFLALNATAKAKILQFLCNELLQNKAVIRQVETAIETVAQLKRDRWTNDSKLRKLRHLHNRKLRQMAIGIIGGKLCLEGVDDEAAPPKDHDDEDENDGESGNESDGTQPEEEEDKNLSVEEMARKLEKLHRQAEQTLNSLSESGGQLRAVCYGQDRYWRRYWSLPTAGGLFVEAMESAEPDLFEELLQQDDADSMETPDIKGEYDAEALQCKNMHLNDDDDDDDEMPLLTPEVDTATLLSKYKAEEHMDEDSAPLPNIQSCNEELESKAMIKLCKEESETTGVIKVLKDTLESNGNIEEEKKLKEEDVSANKDEEKLVKDFFGREEDTKEKLDTEDKKFCEDVKTGEDGSIVNGQTEATEPAWFSILPREPCDNTSVTSTASAFRCGSENIELRIPVFPPPPASPSPSQCDSPSPAPLALTPEEHAQLQHCKVHGLPTPAPAKPIPYDMRCGWWRITDTAVLQQLVENLHTRGTREKDLRRNITKLCLDQNWTTMLKMCVRPGSSATELLVNQDDIDLPQMIPPRDSPDTWNYSVALRVDMSLLEQVEAMEDKVANASMQVKGWKVPPRASNAEGRVFQPSSSHPPSHLNPVAVAKQRLLDLESVIERRYLKPPLGINVTPVEVSLSGTSSNELDTIPKGLMTWRDAVAKSQTAAQLSMGLHMLEASIAWDKSIMKANCQFCHSGDNEDKLLLCDGCDKGYHTYCFKPKMENIPEGDWFCVECMNKATGEKCCIVCGKKQGRNLMICDNCPKAYHTDCLQPPVSKVPRGKWHCPACFAKLPRKRLYSKRTMSSSHNSSTSPSSSFNRSVDDGSSSNAEAFLSSPMDQDEAPESPPPLLPVVKKEKTTGKKLAREMAPCRQILDDMESHDDAWPFLLPVNTKQFPTYKKIIKNPMDLSTVKKRLMDSVYKSREEFCSDVRLIFNNCETFNEDDSPVGKAGHNMRLFFETRWTDLS